MNSWGRRGTGHLHQHNRRGRCRDLPHSRVSGLVEVSAPVSGVGFFGLLSCWQREQRAGTFVFVPSRRRAVTAAPCNRAAASELEVAATGVVAVLVYAMAGDYHTGTELPSRGLHQAGLGGAASRLPGERGGGQTERQEASRSEGCSCWGGGRCWGGGCLRQLAGGREVLGRGSCWGEGDCVRELPGRGRCASVLGREREREDGDQTAGWGAFRAGLPAGWQGGRGGERAVERGTEGRERREGRERVKGGKGERGGRERGERARAASKHGRSQDETSGTKPMRLQL